MSGFMWRCREVIPSPRKHFKKIYKLILLLKVVLFFSNRRE